jgi:hypothetical protein
MMSIVSQKLVSSLFVSAGAFLAVNVQGLSLTVKGGRDYRCYVVNENWRNTAQPECTHSGHSYYTEQERDSKIADGRCMTHRVCYCTAEGVENPEDPDTQCTLHENEVRRVAEAQAAMEASPEAQAIRLANERHAAWVAEEAARAEAAEAARREADRLRRASAAQAQESMREEEARLLREAWDRYHEEQAMQSKTGVKVASRKSEKKPTKVATKTKEAAPAKKETAAMKTQPGLVNMLALSASHVKKSLKRRPCEANSATQKAITRN